MRKLDCNTVPRRMNRLTNEERRRLRQYERAWSKKLEPFQRQTRKAEQLSEDDLSARVNTVA